MGVDIAYRIETPEGIDLQTEIAGPVPRILAYAADLGLRSIVIVALSIGLRFIPGHSGTAILLLVSFFSEWLYPVFFEVLGDGQTPGKKWLRIAVINDDLTPVRWSASLMRNLLRAVDFLPFAFLGGLIGMLLTKKFQRLGDLAAGTLVVHRGAARERHALPSARATPPPPQLSVDDQLALINFAQRHQELSADRQRELAAILIPALGLEADTAVEQLRGMGLWLLGER